MEEICAYMDQYYLTRLFPFSDHHWVWKEGSHNLSHPAFLTGRFIFNLNRKQFVQMIFSSIFQYSGEIGYLT